MSDPVVLLSTGDVVGPAGGVTDNSMVLFSGTSGKLIKGNNAVVTAAGLALLDDVNAAAQRTTLGLGTAATATLTTSATDGTAGRVMKVGDFGLGATSSGWGTYDLDTLDGSGFYNVNGSTSTGLPDPGLFGFLTFIDSTVTDGYQIFTQAGVPSTARTWRRTKVVGAWDTWQEIALINSPAFTGTPTAPTATPGTDTTQLATTAFVKAAAAPMLGVGQTWQNVTGSRTTGTTYTNTTGKPIFVHMVASQSANTNGLLTVNGVGLQSTYIGNNLNGWYCQISSIIPPGGTYVFTGGTVATWAELR